MRTTSDSLTFVSIVDPWLRCRGGPKKQGKQNVVFRFILAKRDKNKIVAWSQDLFRILHVFNVRSMALLRIYELSPLSDRAGDRH
jgi:hypothetical protein